MAEHPLPGDHRFQSTAHHPLPAMCFFPPGALSCQFLYLQEPLNFWMRFLLFLLHCFVIAMEIHFGVGCCGDHQPPLSASRGTSTFRAASPALAVHVPLLQCELGGDSARRRAVQTAAGLQGLLIQVSPKQTAQAGWVVLQRCLLHTDVLLLIVSHWALSPALLLFLLQLGLVRRC